MKDEHEAFGKRYTEDKINTKEKGSGDKKKTEIKSKFDQKKEDSMER